MYLPGRMSRGFFSCLLIAFAAAVAPATLASPILVGEDERPRGLEDLLDPNRNVDVAFRTTTIVTNDGKAYSGLLKELEGNRISIIDSQAKETILQTDSVEERLASTNSPMPSNFGETLKEDQLKDLVSYLLKQRKLVEPSTKP